MTIKNPEDDTLLINRQRAVEVLTEALEAEELDEKNYQIREALHLLTMKDDREHSR